MSGRWRTLCSGLITLAAVAGLVVVGPVEAAVAAGQRGAAFVRNYDPSPPLMTPYTPVGEYQYNSTSPGAPNNQVVRTATGTYTVVIPGVAGFGATHATAYGWDADGRLSTATRQGPTYVVRIPGLASSSGHVQVTADDNGSRCKVAMWVPSGADELVMVNCWHRGGFDFPENAPFVLTYVNQQNILGLPAGVPPDGHESAYAWADQPGSLDEYTPHTSYQYSGADYAATAAGFGSGRYLMRFNGLNMYNGNVQVTAYGWGSDLCGINYWLGSSVQVQCYTERGKPVDTLYTVAFTGL